MVASLSPEEGGYPVVIASKPTGVYGVRARIEPWGPVDVGYADEELSERSSRW
jgi:hypothetical protein